MKRITSTILFLLVVSSLLVACATPTPTVAPVVTEPPATEAPTATAVPTEPPAAEKIAVTDALGRTVEFDQYPTRIVIAGKAGFMIANAAFLFPEALDRVVAYVPGAQTPNDFISIVFPSAAGLAQVATDSSVEQLAPLNPDVVLLKSYLKETLGDPLEQVGIKVLYLNLESAEAIDQDVRTLGALFGNPDKAEQVVALNEANVERITSVTNELTDEQKPSVLLLQYSDKGGEIAFKVPPLDWLQTNMVELAGGIPVWSDVPTDGWTTVTLEQIAVWNPQVILLVDYKGNGMDIVSQLKADEKWALLGAVKNNQLFAFPLDFQSWDQPDTRWTLGMTWIALKLHPDLFTTISVQDEIKSFYKNYYGLSDSVIDETILPLVKGDF
ncbi:MAG TPA: ABC transporter substrate-binding protein [Anaerolineaceae bacterium]|nr:ABC transporter substrate-binding protein [Anaerolineaceae bacterium]